MKKKEINEKLIIGISAIIKEVGVNQLTKKSKKLLTRATKKIAKRLKVDLKKQGKKKAKKQVQHAASTNGHAK